MILDLTMLSRYGTKNTSSKNKLDYSKIKTYALKLSLRTKSNSQNEKKIINHVSDKDY